MEETRKSESTSRRDFIAKGAGLAVAATFGFTRTGHAQTGTEITQIASFKIQAGKEAEAIKLLQTLADAVEKNEPGVLAYIAHTAGEEQKEVVFYEIYKDAAALQAHGQTPHLGALRSNFANLFMPPVDIKRLTKVGGYSR